MIKKLGIVFLAALFVLSVATGCQVKADPAKLTPDSFSKIKGGVSTLDDIRSLIGMETKRDGDYACWSFGPSDNEKAEIWFRKNSDNKTVAYTIRQFGLGKYASSAGDYGSDAVTCFNYYKVKDCTTLDEAQSILGEGEFSYYGVESGDNFRPSIESEYAKLYYQEGELALNDPSNLLWVNGYIWHQCGDLNKYIVVEADPASNKIVDSFQSGLNEVNPASDAAIDLSKITMDNFMKIGRGMSYEDIKDILGDGYLVVDNTEALKTAQPGDPYNPSKPDPHEEVVMWPLGNKTAAQTEQGDEGITVGFQDGVVSVKSQYGLTADDKAYQSAGLSADSYNAVKENMTVDEVEGILGKGELTKECYTYIPYTDNQDEYDDSYYIWKSKDEEQVINIDFQEGKANSKNQYEVIDEPDGFSDQATKENYDRINTGMTYDEVKSIIGEGAAVTNGFSVSGYMWSGPDGLLVQIDVQDGIVTEKSCIE
jgi:hypothetical protein